MATTHHRPLYPRPPITEAVIELRFKSACSDSNLVKISKSFKKHYPGLGKFTAYEMLFNVDDKGVSSQVKDKVDSYKLASNDQQEIILLSPRSIVISQIAPYPGWDNFFTRFERDWGIFKKKHKYSEISRIGVRFINRIDIPKSDHATEESEFLTIFPQYPSEFGPCNKYGLSISFLINDINCNFSLNSSVISSPIINHISILLDIDISREKEVPQNDKEIFVLLQKIRDEKNKMFELCITDKSRRLFQ